MISRRRLDFLHFLFLSGLSLSLLDLSAEEPLDQRIPAERNEENVCVVGVTHTSAQQL